MIAVKGQFVRLTHAALMRSPDECAQCKHYGAATVVSLVYLDQPEGSRGVQLDRELGGSRWWPESDLELMPE